MLNLLQTLLNTIIPGSWTNTISIGVVGGVALGITHFAGKVVFQTVLKDKYNHWRSEKQRREKWLKDIENKLIEANLHLTDYRCFVHFKPENQLKNEIDKISKEMIKMANNPPKNISEELVEEIDDLSVKLHSLSVSPGEKDLAAITDTQEEISDIEGNFDELAKEIRDQVTEISEKIEEEK